MIDHQAAEGEPWGEYPKEEPTEEWHRFDAAGTKHRCEKWVPDMGAFCPQPRNHVEEGTPCGPLTGEKLW